MDKDDKMALAVYAASLVGFGERHAPLVFDGYYAQELKNPEPTLKRIADNYEEGIRSVILYGSIGSGKTALLSAMLKRLFARWCGTTSGPAHLLPGTFSTYVNMGTHDSIINTVCNDPDYFELLAGCNLLIIDDLGDCYEDDRGFRLTKTKELIDYRWREALPVWITTNYESSDLSRAWAKAVSRLNDPKWVTKMSIAGEDRRRASRIVRASAVDKEIGQ